MKLIISNDRIAATALDSYQAPPGVMVVDAPEGFEPSRLEEYRFVDGALRLDRVVLVIAERARRFAGGFDYDFGDSRGVHHIGTTPEDLAGWDEVTTLSSAFINLGNGSATIDIVTNTGPVTLTATEWQSILVAAGLFRQPIWAASFVLQAMDPIPPDFADDSYWP
jgi:hypothetical protein